MLAMLCRALIQFNVFSWAQKDLLEISGADATMEFLPQQYVLHLRMDGAFLHRESRHRKGAVEVKPPTFSSKPSGLLAVSVPEEADASSASLAAEPAFTDAPVASESKRTRKLSEKAALLESEAKRRGDALEDEHLAGQVFDYLQLMRAVDGVAHPIAIVSSYLGWRVAWLPDSDEFVAADAVPVQDDSKFADQEERILPAAWKMGEPVMLTAQDAVSNLGNVSVDGRFVSATPVCAVTDHQKLCRMVCSALIKMAASPILPRTLVSNARLYPKITATRYEYMQLPRDANAVRFSMDLPARSTRNFFILGSLGSGRDGSVALACCEKGVGCVIKFRRVLGRGLSHVANVGGATARQNELALLTAAAEQEAQRWNLLGFEGVFSATGAKSAFVVMPYFRVLSDDEWNEPRFHDAARNTCSHMAEKGIFHQDLKREHVAYYLNDSGQPVTVLLDLSDVAKINAHDQSACQRGAAAMIKALRLPLDASSNESAI